MAKRTEMSKYNKHFTWVNSKSVKDYATNEILGYSKYIFVTRENGTKMGYCTHCRKSFDMPFYKHNEFTHCPKCNSSCQVKDTRYKYTKLRDSRQFYTFRKSKVDPNMVVGIFCYTCRDYTDGYKNVKTHISERGRYVFEIGGAKMFRTCWYGDWFRCASVFPLDNLTEYQNPTAYFDHNSLSKAVEGTPFEHIYTRKNGWDYLIRSFTLFCEYPFIEYLLKGPFGNLIEGYIFGHCTHRTLNWRAKTPHGFFKLSKQCYKQLKDENISFSQLYVIQQLEKHNYKWDMDQVDKIDSAVMKNGYSSKSFTPKKLIGLLSAEQICNYIDKQMQCHTDQGERPVYSYESAMVGEWLDYLAECVTLEYDITDSLINRPKDLRSVHIRTSALIKHKADELLDKKFKQRYDELFKKYSYSNDKYFIRPAASTTEIIEEGKLLKHCVGGYAYKHAKGLTTILFVRKKSEPDAPFYTMEVSNYDKKRGSFTQCRGLKNKGYTGIKGLEEFLDSFAKEKIKKSNKSKEQKAI